MAHPSGKTGYWQWKNSAACPQHCPLTPANTFFIDGSCYIGLDMAVHVNNMAVHVNHPFAGLFLSGGEFAAGNLQSVYTAGQLSGRTVHRRAIFFGLSHLKGLWADTWCGATGGL